VPKDDAVIFDPSVKVGKHRASVLNGRKKVEFEVCPFDCENLGARALWESGDLWSWGS